MGATPKVCSCWEVGGSWFGITANILSQEASESEAGLAGCCGIAIVPPAATFCCSAEGEMGRAGEGCAALSSQTGFLGGRVFGLMRSLYLPRKVQVRFLMARSHHDCPCKSQPRAAQDISFDPLPPA